jgi:DNA uptake protein ComE-like DNA-binding protein
VTAQRIVKAREEGPFVTVDSLVDRGVVARSVVDRLAGQLTVGRSPG